MGMDGLYRPSQALGYTDTIGHLNAADRAERDARIANRIDLDRSVDAISKDPPQKDRHENPKEKEEEDTGLEEELKEIFTLKYNVELDPNTVYRFTYNEVTDRFELIDTTFNRVLLTLTPEDFLQITESMSHSSGIISNRIA
jgi:hypothetical protein